MMDKIILSLNPKWCSLILSGKKIIEIRKSKPCCTCPFKVYLYETKRGRGGVVGECICFCAAKVGCLDNITAGSCLTENEITEYSKGKKIYAWFVGKIVQYDEIKSLSDFEFKKAPQSWCYVKEGKIA